jgi:hypothetical protein
MWVQNRGTNPLSRKRRRRNNGLTEKFLLFSWIRMLVLCWREVTHEIYGCDIPPRGGAARHSSARACYACNCGAHYVVLFKCQCPLGAASRTVHPSFFGLWRPQIEGNWENFDIRIPLRISANMTQSVRRSAHGPHSLAMQMLIAAALCFLSSFRRCCHACLIPWSCLLLSIATFSHSSSSLSAWIVSRYDFCLSVFLVISIFLFYLLPCDLLLFPINSEARKDRSC